MMQARAEGAIPIRTVQRSRPRVRAGAGVLAACSLVLAGCSGESARLASASWLDAVPERILEPAYRLGGPDAPEHLSFQSPPQVAVGRSGHLYVQHAEQGRVAVLDEAGGFVRWIGGLGEGPGEFQIAAAIGLVGDTLWVRNWPTPRISRFLTDGTHISTERTLYDFDYRMTAPAGVSGYLEGGRAWIEPDALVAGQEGQIELPVMVGDRAMSTEDTLFTVPNPRGRLAGMAFAPFEQPPFHDAAADGRGILLAEWSETNAGAVRVRFFSPAGSEEQSWTVAFTEKPVSSALRDSLIDAGIASVEALAERLAGQGIPAGSYRETISRTDVEAEVYLPHFSPPVRRVLVGVDDTYWIQLTTGQAEAGDWLAFDTAGAPLFRVRVPDGARLQQASRKSVWATLQDALDVSYVVRWDLVES
jgi:hypothetical protein